MLVNLFDSLFVGNKCSVAWRESRAISYVRDLPEFDGVTIFTDSQINSQIVERVRSDYKIGWLREPRCLHPETYDALDPTRFDAVFTYSEEMFDNPRCTFVPYGGVWVADRHWGVRDKSRLVSMLYGAKRSAPGHLLRHEIAVRIAGVDYYGYSGVPVNYSRETKRLVHQEYMFSIVVETCNDPNLFTEILLDCMVMGTVPVLWGCPNSGEFFDDRGIIHFDTVDELSTVVSELSESLYKSKARAIRNNLRIAAQYAVTEDWMYTHLLRYYERG